MISNDRFFELLEKFTEGTISSHEHDLLFECVRAEEFHEILSAHIDAKLRDKNVPGENLPAHRASEIIHKIVAAEKQTSRIITHPSLKSRKLYFTMAAAIAGLIFLGAYLLKFSTGDALPRRPDAKAPVVQSIVAGKNTTVENNYTSDPLTYKLEDGSVIVLKPGSSITYPRHFMADKREVYLKGEAFFQITKNAARPFYVYTKTIVTHVLGTSFSVKENNAQKQSEVAVSSGKVEVYKKIDERTDPTGPAIILLPNQKATYHEGDRHFVATLVDVPMPIPVSKAEKAQQKTETENIYDEAELSQVFCSLQKSYGIEIIVENENIYKCLFTGDITKQNLYTKIDIICKALNTSYEIVGTKIMIRGRGCY